MVHMCTVVPISLTVEQITVPTIAIPHPPVTALPAEEEKEIRRKWIGSKALSTEEEQTVFSSTLGGNHEQNI